MGENRKWGWVLAFTVLVAIGLSIVTIIALRRVQQNSASIRQLEASDNKQAIALIAALDKANDQQDAAIVLIRQTNYRLCVRQQIVRAAINLDENGDEPRLPLYDCTPDLTGGEAKLLTPAQRKKFLAYVKAGKNLP